MRVSGRGFAGAAAAAFASALCWRFAEGAEDSVAIAFGDAGKVAFGNAAIIFDDAGDFSFRGAIFALRE